MARPKKIGARHKVNVQVTDYDYAFLERNATKYGFSKSEVVRQIIDYYRDKGGENSVVASLEETEFARLNEIARDKHMTSGELASRVLSAYLSI